MKVFDMTPKIKAYTAHDAVERASLRWAASGTGKKIYPAKCELCEGKDAN